MPKKRRNGGKNRCGRGSVKPIRCANCGRCTPKDKAVKRFQVRNMVENAAHRDLKEASVYKDFEVPKFYMKAMHCVSCAIHARIVRSRGSALRRQREQPPRPKKGQKMPDAGKPMKGLKKSARRLKPVVFEKPVEKL